MRKVFCMMLICILLMPTMTVFAAEVQSETDTETPQVPSQVISLGEPLGEMPFDVSAPSVLLCEASSGQVIFQKNANEKRQVASVTKLMTLLLVFEALEDGRMTKDQVIPVSAKAAGMGGSQALLDAGGEYPVIELLKSVIIASANDAAVALAEKLYGSEEAFVRRMNGRAAELGLYDTVYANCTGLTADNHYTTAADVAKLSMVVSQYDQLYEFSTIWMDEIVHNNGRKTELVNTNRMIRTYTDADGLKTGSTNAAGFCVSASAERDDMRLIAVVLGASSSSERFSAASKMLDYGFDHYYMMDIVAQGELVTADYPVTDGTRDTVNVLAGEDVRAMIMKGEEHDLYFETQLPESLKAPLAQGETIGEIVVYKSGQEIGRASAVAADDVGNAGFWSEIRKVLLSWF